MIRTFIAAVGAAAALGGCASASPGDPFEPVNRAVFRFNDVLDENVSQPVARGYQAVLPELVRAGVTNFFSNLGDVWIGVNDLLQGKVYETASDVMRISMNTVLGLGGLLDVASSAQLQKHDEDFGQTLGRWGVPPGPYLVVPFFGPSDLRDGVGLAVDLSFSPIPSVAHAAGPTGHWMLVQNGMIGLNLINTRANLLRAGDLASMAAIDRYSFFRGAYQQRRRNQVYDGNPPPLRDDDDDDPKNGGSR